MDGVVRFVFRNAVVHGPYGVVTLGRVVVEDTLLHVWAPWAGAQRDGDLWTFGAPYVARRMPTAEHLMCGNAGNYYHWLLDGMVRWCATPPGSAFGGSLPVLLSWTGAAFQHQGPGLFPGLAARASLLGLGHAVSVDRLVWTPNLTGAGAQFHPAIRRTADALRGAVRPGGARRIYVSRRDAANRRLLNEDAVEALCRAHGYSVVQLSTMAVGEQIALFAGADRIVAPHGAGLANILVCPAGASVLELTMDADPNPCFENLASSLGLRWSRILGPTDAGPDWVHHRTWTLPLDQLDAALVERAGEG